jgi:hypothetical protein
MRTPALIVTFGIAIAAIIVAGAFASKTHRLEEQLLNEQAKVKSLKIAKTPVVQVHYHIHSYDMGDQ